MLKKFYNSIYYIFIISILVTFASSLFIQQYERAQWQKNFSICMDNKEYMNIPESERVTDEFGFWEVATCSKIVNKKPLYVESKRYHNFRFIWLMSFITLCISSVVILFKIICSIINKAKYVLTDNNSLKSQRYGLILTIISTLYLLILVIFSCITNNLYIMVHSILFYTGIFILLSGLLLLYCIFQKITSRIQKITTWIQKGK